MDRRFKCLVIDRYEEATFGEMQRVVDGLGRERLVRLGKDSHTGITSLTAEGENKPLVMGFVRVGPMLVRAGFP